MTFSIRNLTIWIIVPLSYILIPFIRRFLLGCSGLWFFDMSIILSLIIFTYTMFYILLEEKHFSSRYLALILVFQPFALLLTFIGGPIENIPWAVYIRNQIRDDGGLQAIIGLLQGLCGVYVYLLGDRLNKFFLRDLSQEYINRLQNILMVVSIFSVIINVATFATRAPYTLFWPLRSILLISGFLLGIISITSGIVWSYRLNILFLLGGLFNFCINFIVGVMIIPLTRIDECIFPAMMAFVLNSSLLTGLVCYLISDRNSFLSTFIQLIISNEVPS